MNNSIIAAESDHVPAMIEIFKFAQDKHFKAFSDVFCPPENPEAIASYLNRFLKPRNPFRSRRHYSTVFVVDGKVAGYLLYQLYQSSDVFMGENRWHCFVDDIAVHPDYRGKGGASRLLESLSATVKKYHGCLVSAQVWRGNEASEALFEKFGFIGKSQNYYLTID